MPLQIVRQDITKIQVDAIVNPTNREMIGYSGVDFAVHKAAGPELEKQCRVLAPIEKGAAVVTSGYKLPCRYIIHTVGPIWEGGQNQEEELLKRCYVACLHSALERNCETVAFPLISSGAYGYPKELVLSLAVKIITDFLLEHEMSVYLCVFDKTSYSLSRKLLLDVEAYIDDRYVSEKSELLDAEYSRLKAPRIRSVRKREFSEAAEMSVPGMGNEPCFSAVSVQNQLSLEDRLKALDQSFSSTLLQLIDEKGMTDVECYKRANISRKTFSKIRCVRDYRPSKETVIAFAIALRLTLDETNAFLSTAGFSLSPALKSDVIVEYFISKGVYDIFEINQTLFDFDQPCLGC